MKKITQEEFDQLLESRTDEKPLRLRDRELSEKVFHKSLSNIVFTNCIFRKCRFLSITFERVSFRNCEFEATEFTNTKFKYGEFISSYIRDFKFEKVNFEYLSILNCNFNKGHFKENYFGRVNFDWFDFHEVTGLADFTPDPNLKQKIKEQVIKHPKSFDMESYHSPCRTVHCIAGWAITLHPEGRRLEDRFGTSLAARLLLNLTSEEGHVFHLDEKEALVWLDN